MSSEITVHSSISVLHNRFWAEVQCLGTSSSFAVGMLSAFYALKGKYADKRKLADDAIYLERELCKEAGGIQDQIAASFGVFNRINVLLKLLTYLLFSLDVDTGQVLH